MRKYLLLAVAVWAAVAPALAEARAGSSVSVSRPSVSRSYTPSRSYAPAKPTVTYQNQSVGSKGVNTYKPSQTYQPVQKSVTPQPTTSVAANRYPTTTSTTTVPSTTHVTSSTTVVNHNYGGGYGGYGSGGCCGGVGTFLAGTMFGGLLGYGLHSQPTVVVAGGGAPMVAGAPVAGGVVEPGVGYAQPVAVAPSYGFGEFLIDVVAFVFVFILLAFIVWVLVKIWRRMFRDDDEVEVVHSTRVYHTESQPTYEPEPVVEEFRATSDDKAEFKDVLTRIQKAWSERDNAVLKGLLTAEMFDYFSNALEDNTAQGVVNRVENVHGVECDVLEAWVDPDGHKYATAIMRWSAHDYTTDLNGRIIDQGETGYVRETWTFKRVYGRWVLSAVQQMED